MNRFDLDGRVALVTGGARGIGEECVRALHDAGARVVVADILDDELIRLRRDLTADLTTARARVDDVAEETQVYLEVALAPDITYTDVNTYVTWVFDAAAGHPDEQAHAAALAAAALRGWNHRQALAARAAR